MGSPTRHPERRPLGRSRRTSGAALLTILLVLITSEAHAHAVRPAYLDVTERQPGRYRMTLRLPDPREPGPLPVLPEGCESLTPPMVRQEAAGPVMRLEVGCGDGGLEGRILAFTDFPPGCREVLVHLRPFEGPVHAAVVSRDAPELVVPAAGEDGGVPVGEYLGIGVEHILLGPDHLLFVLGLLLIVGLGRSSRGRYPTRRLLGTVTAFTLAHSITLSLAVLGHVSLPGPPVELVISLSILLLAVELSRAAVGGASAPKAIGPEAPPTVRVGPEGPPTAGKTLTLRYPWAVAFLFGLLHGFGFAGALADIGFPEDAIAMALLLFNVGVEIGQVAFIVVMLGVGWALRRTPLPASPILRRGAVYAMGCMAAFWCWDRFWWVIRG